MNQMPTDPSPDETVLSCNQKALHINLDPARYGTLAEIGAGQEVSRYFFRVGGASGTVAKSMSAYDMIFSDEIYGKAPRYVSRERLQHMLDHEYHLLVDRLAGTKGEQTCFFAFADTVATRSYEGNQDSHGWMGIRFQQTPKAPPSQVIIHLRMLDRSAEQQQVALGIVGINLIFGSFYQAESIDTILDSLRDNLEENRIEIDMFECSGPAFEQVDNRITSVKLVEKGYTNAVLFGPDQQVLQPSSVLRKQPILLGRGGFRPLTKVNMDMMQCASSRFSHDFDLSREEIFPLFEITLNNLRRTQNSSTIDYRDLLQRVDVINAVDMPVLVSNYFEYFRLSAYFRRYTQAPIGIVLGINNLLEIFNQDYYENLEGGILEAFGRLFKSRVLLFLYPMLRQSLLHYLELRYQDRDREADAIFFQQLGSESEDLIHADNVRVEANLRNLYKYLLENEFLRPVQDADREVMTVFPRDVLEMIRSGDPQWKSFVPESAAREIESLSAFGLRKEEPS